MKCTCPERWTGFADMAPYCAIHNPHGVRNMTDGASGHSIDELKPSNNDPFPAIMMGILIAIFIVLSFISGWSLHKNPDCPSPVYHLHKHHEVWK